MKKSHQNFLNLIIQEANTRRTQNTFARTKNLAASDIIESHLLQNYLSMVEVNMVFSTSGIFFVSKQTKAFPAGSFLAKRSA